jgi:hypothetical protein
MFRFFLVLLISAGSIISAQSLQDSLLVEGIEYSNNFEFQEAEEIFDQYIEQNPESPFGYHFLSKIHLWAFMGTRNEGEYGTFIKFSDIAIENAETQLDQNEDNLELRFILGSAFTLRAMAKSIQQKTMGAFWDAKSANGYLEEVIDQDPKFYDAYLGIGIFEYALSYVPGFLKFAIGLTGMNIDKKEGLRKIKLVFEKGDLNRTEAAFHLSKIYTDYTAQYDSAEFYLKYGLNNYSKNLLFYYQLSVVKIKQRDLDSAKVLLDKVFELENQYFAQTKSYAYMLMGDVFFRQNKFKKAVENYKEFFQSTRQIDYLGIANLRAALSYGILGNDSLFQKYMLMTTNGNDEIPEDRYAIEKSSEYIKTGLKSEDILLVKAYNDLQAGKYRRVVEKLGETLEFSIKIQKGKRLIYLSEANIFLGNYQRAVDLAGKALKIDYNEERWIIPYANYLSAETQFKQENFKRSHRFLEVAESENDYSYPPDLSPRIENLRLRLQRISSEK